MRGICLSYTLSQFNQKGMHVSKCIEHSMTPSKRLPEFQFRVIFISSFKEKKRRKKKRKEKKKMKKDDIFCLEFRIRSSFKQIWKILQTFLTFSQTNFIETFTCCDSGRYAQVRTGCRETVGRSTFSDDWNAPGAPVKHRGTS